MKYIIIIIQRKIKLKIILQKDIDNIKKINVLFYR